MIAFGAGNHLSDIFMEDNLILQISKGQRAEIRQEGLSPIINIMVLLFSEIWRLSIALTVAWMAVTLRGLLLTQGLKHRAAKE